MSDPVSPTTPDAPIGDSKPVKKPGILRKAAFIIFGVMLAIFLVVLPWWVDRWALGMITSALADRGLELRPGSKLSVSVFGMRLSGSALAIGERSKPTDPPTFTADKLNAKLAIMDTISSGDVIVDDLTLEGVTGDLRRRGDGNPPIMPEDGKGGGSGEAKGQNWGQIAKRVLDYWKNRKDQEEKDKESSPSKPPVQKPPKPTLDWTGAVRYEPTPVPPTPGMHIPRVLVRNLSISGKSFGLPDQTPFDVTSFSVKGATIATRLNADEVMTLTGSIQTLGAGPMDLAMKRAGNDTGTMSVKASQLPVETLGDPKISGDGFARYGAKGLAALDFSSQWTGWDLVGEVTSTVKNLSMSPGVDAGDRAQQVAQVVNNLKDQTIVWPVKLGGTLYAPTITDNGVETVIKTAGTSAVKNAAIERGEKELDKAVGDKLKDQPAAQDAVNKAKDLLKGWGK